MVARGTLSVVRGEAATLSLDDALVVYRAMLRIRLLDERMMTLQRQGRIGFYGSCQGEEAAAVASAFPLEPNDWIFPALRQGGALLMRGFPLRNYIGQVFGNTADVNKGRQMPSHQSSRDQNDVSWSSCIGTQLPQAVGAAYAARFKKDPVVVMAYMGDGATSSADFHVAMNFAGVWKAPVVFFCQNNHWSISVPTNRQTASENMAIKAKAYGFPGVKVDGNDAFAVYAACKTAVDRARGGGGPTLVEAETYRIGAHSSSDDPTRYRDNREVEAWKARDPLPLLLHRLTGAAKWDEQRDLALRGELLQEINDAIADVEPLPPPGLDTLFDDVYAAMLWHLTEERDVARSSTTEGS
jgi:pyruvate dehydrogenase E1 component alpha subunit